MLLMKGEGATRNHSKIAEVWAALSEDDRLSWTVERPGAAAETPEQLLEREEEGYCSFIVQRDRAAAEQLLQHARSAFPAELHFADAIWVFYCRPSAAQDTQGRPEHLDSVSHAGTMHVQLSGQKVWHVRHREGGEPAQVLVEAGDVFALDTKNWYHCTSIPSSSGEPSVSLARDMYRSEEELQAAREEGMTNVDGAYATEEIPEGTLLFTSMEQPDVELGVSSEPNVELVLLDQDTELYGVVSLRDIAVGEFLCVAEDEDE